jgi:hypothetical protein
MPDDPTTQELRLEQARRVAREREQARDADEPSETDQHARRADKASYLSEKLAERAESEERVERDS